MRAILDGAFRGGCRGQFVCVRLRTGGTVEAGRGARDACGCSGHGRWEGIGSSLRVFEEERRHPTRNNNTRFAREVTGPSSGVNPLLLLVNNLLEKIHEAGSFIQRASVPVVISTYIRRRKLILVEPTIKQVVGCQLFVLVAQQIGLHRLLPRESKRLELFDTG